jgi:hypothetical protein
MFAGPAAIAAPLLPCCSSAQVLYFAARQAERNGRLVEGFLKRCTAAVEIYMCLVCKGDIQVCSALRAASPVNHIMLAQA